MPSDCLLLPHNVVAVMFSAIAIDIGWFLTISNEADWDQERAAHDVLNQLIQRGIPILQDYEGAIAREYATHLKDTPLGLRFTAKMNKIQQVTWVTGTPNRACGECLDEIGFDPSDIPYVGAASQANGVYLTHETKHLEPRRAEQIFECCGVRIVGTLELASLFT